MPFPTENDTANVGAILAENSQATELDMAFGAVNLAAYVYTSKVVTVPLNLVQDSAFDLDSYIARKLGIRLGRIQNTHFTVGTGTNQPRGIVIDATSGKVGLTGQTLSIIYDDLVDLEHAVDPAYRPQSKFMLHDSSLKVIKKIKDTTGRPLWRSSLEGIGVSVGNNPDTVNGYPYVINNDMAVMAANAKSVLFGDFSNYAIRDVLGVTVMRLTERFADFFQVGFIAWARADGALLDAGTHPVAYYANSAT
jgi:HK97 family phage major capsid protein